MSTDQSRYLRLIEAHDLCGLHLTQAELANPPGDNQGQIAFEIQFVGVRKAEVFENIAAANFVVIVCEFHR